MSKAAVKTGNLRSITAAAFAREYTSTAQGKVLVVFPSGLFKAPPILEAVGFSGADGYTINVSAVEGTLTKDGVTLLVKKASAPMPTVLSLLDLKGYAPDALVSGVRVHVTARTAT